MMQTQGVAGAVVWFFNIPHRLIQTANNGLIAGSAVVVVQNRLRGGIVISDLLLKCWFLELLFLKVWRLVIGNLQKTERYLSVESEGDRSCPDWRFLSVIRAILLSSSCASGVAS